MPIFFNAYLLIHESLTRPSIDFIELVEPVFIMLRPAADSYAIRHCIALLQLSWSILHESRISFHYWFIAKRFQDN
jgi:hypothetical protein